MEDLPATARSSVTFPVSKDYDSAVKWLLPPAVGFIVYAVAFATMFRGSSLCYLSTDPGAPQPFLAYGFHPDPVKNQIFNTVFRPFTFGLDPNEMVLDPGDFSGSHGWRLGWRMPLLLWQSTTGTLLLVAFVVSLGIVGTYASPPLMRVVRWGVNWQLQRRIT